MADSTQNRNGLFSADIAGLLAPKLVQNLRRHKFVDIRLSASDRRGMLRIVAWYDPKAKGTGRAAVITKKEFRHGIKWLRTFPPVDPSIPTRAEYVAAL